MSLTSCQSHQLHRAGNRTTSATLLLYLEEGQPKDLFPLNITKTVRGYKLINGAVSPILQCGDGRKDRPCVPWVAANAPAQPGGSRAMGQGAKRHQAGPFPGCSVPLPIHQCPPPAWHHQHSREQIISKYIFHAR